jgi:hypothetical protein
MINYVAILLYAEQGLRFIQRTRHYGSWIYSSLQQISSHVRICIRSVGIVTAYGLERRRIGVQLLGETRDVSPLYWVQIGSGANQVSCPKGTVGCFLGVKWTCRESDHLLQCSV